MSGIPSHKFCDALEGVEGNLREIDLSWKKSKKQILSNVLHPAVSDLVKTIGLLRSVDSYADNILHLNDALLNLYGGIFVPLYDASLKAEIYVTEDIKERYKTLSSDLIRAAKCPTLKRTRQDNSPSKLFAVIDQLINEITAAVDEFSKDGSPHFSSPKGHPAVIEVDYEGAPLRPFTETLLSECPRFRILIVGKTGVGKTSLIKATFGVDSIDSAHGVTGESTIETELTSKANQRFILHDSQGFEPGKLSNFEVVTDFIKRRAELPALQDRLHAIWLCMAVPYANSRLLDKGDEDILALNSPEVPVIAVFTKHDELVSQKRREIKRKDKNLSAEEVRARALREAEIAFETLCLDPLKEVTKRGDFPQGKASIYDRVDLETLVMVTSERVDPRVRLTWDAAQRINLDSCIEATIRVGRGKYWKNLASSAEFPDRTLEDCLGVIHQDILSVWNLNTGSKDLMGDQFKGMMYEVIGDLALSVVSATDRSSRAVAFKTTLLKVVKNSASLLAAPAAPIFPLLVAGAAMFRWTRELYRKQDPHVLRCMMGYVVDMTVIMQGLFWVMRSRFGESSGPITEDLIRIVVDGFMESANRRDIHRKIRHSVQNMGTFEWQEHGDGPLDKVIELLRDNRFDPEAILIVTGD